MSDLSGNLPHVLLGDIDPWLILNHLPSGIVVLDQDGVLRLANAAAARFLGDVMADLTVGTSWKTVPGAEPLLAVFDEVRTTGRVLQRREILFEIPERGEKSLGLSAAPLTEHETLWGVIFLFTDLTDVRKSERAAALTRQLATLGELTAGVVHELRNPISVISGMAELLLRKLDSRDECRETAETILRESIGLERAISQFLAFAKPYDPEKTRCHPDDIARRALQFCRRRAQHKNVSVEYYPQGELPHLFVDADRIAQALGNILTNAVDAVSEGGNVQLRAAKEDEYFLFEVLDNGPGIHLHPGEDLFTPFFTQKEGGTGLGLTIAHRIVTAHRGSITYANRKDGGARFELRLPLAVSPFATETYNP